MLTFADGILLALLCGILVLIFFSMRRRKKRGGCSGCSGCSSCSPCTKQKQ